MTLRRAKSGRRYSSRNPARLVEGREPSGSTPIDPRIRLPRSKRRIERRTLKDGTVVISYLDQPGDSAPSMEEAEALLEPAPDAPAPDAPDDDDDTPPPGEGTDDPWERLR